MTYLSFEEELIKGLKNRNNGVFSIVFRLHYSPLCAYAVTIVKDKFLAEEIVQETFVRIWENLGQLNIETSLRGYLFRSVHNHCLNTVKNLETHKKRAGIVSTEIEYHARLALLNFNESLLEHIISEELEAIFDDAIEQLPAQCREVFQLSRYEQLSYAEIAQKLNISINTVKTQISRALEKLREVYSKL